MGLAMRPFTKPGERLSPLLDKPSSSESGMIRHHKGRVVFYTFPHLGWGVKHAIFTRLGGLSHSPFDGLNVGHPVGDEDKAVEANHRIIYETLDLSAREVVTARQVHSHSVAVVGPKDKGRIVPATDGLVTETPGLALMLRFADCLPILLYDPQKQVIGLGHAGWRGTVGLLAQRLAQTMGEEFGCHLSQVRAGLGPAIGPCCYSVGEEVREAVQAVLPHSSGAVTERADGLYLDLWEANLGQLRQLGIQRIEVGKICTACNTDEFFSHRAEGEQTGRFAVLMLLQGE